MRIWGLEAVEELRTPLWRGAGNDAPKSMLIPDDVSLLRIVRRRVADALRVEGALRFRFVGVDSLQDHLIQFRIARCFTDY